MRFCLRLCTCTYIYTTIYTFDIFIRSTVLLSREIVDILGLNLPQLSVESMRSSDMPLSIIIIIIPYLTITYVHYTYTHINFNVMDYIDKFQTSLSWIYYDDDLNWIKENHWHILICYIFVNPFDVGMQIFDHVAFFYKLNFPIELMKSIIILTLLIN